MNTEVGNKPPPPPQKQGTQLQCKSLWIKASAKCIDVKQNKKTLKEPKKKQKLKAKHEINNETKTEKQNSSVPVLFCELDPWPASLSWGSSRAPQTPQYLLQSDSNPVHPHG